MDPLEFESLVREKAAAAVHFDAEWDAANRTIIRQQMREAEASLSDRVRFCEVDCDKNPDFAKSIPIINVPSVAYYAQGKLIAVVVGATQDVRTRLDQLLTRKMIDPSS